MAVEALLARRSCRNYDPSYVISDEDMKTILDCALNAPSCLNFQDNDIIVITDKEKLDKIDQIAFDILPEERKPTFLNMQKQFGAKQKMLYDCSALILLVKNERGENPYIGMNTGLVAMSIMTAAQGLGLNSTPIGITVRPEVEEALGLKKGQLCLSIALGKEKEHKVMPKETLRKVTFWK